MPNDNYCYNISHSMRYNVVYLVFYNVYRSYRVLQCSVSRVLQCIEIVSRVLGEMHVKQRYIVRKCIQCSVYNVNVYNVSNLFP